MEQLLVALAAAGGLATRSDLLAAGIPNHACSGSITDSDGRRHHADAFESDRVRQNELHAPGYS